MKSDLATMLTNKADVLSAYKGLQKIVEFYEDLNLNQYVDNKSRSLVLNNPDNSSLKESMTHTNSNLRNSFVDIYHWVQGELYDIQALVDAVSSRHKIEENLLSL